MGVTAPAAWNKAANEALEDDLLARLQLREGLVLDGVALRMLQ